MNKQQITNSLKVITLALVLSFGIQFAAAQSWTPPTSAPPGNNTYAPINVGASGQVKDGGLTLGLGLSSTPSQFSLLAPYGKVGIGSGVNTAQNPDYNNSNVRLDIFGSGTQRLKIQSTDAAGTARLDLVGKATGGGNNAWHIESYQDKFQLVESGVATRMVMMPGGRVGIGTLTPGANASLTLAGRIKIEGGNPAAGKVLASDAGGLSRWATKNTYQANNNVGGEVRVNTNTTAQTGFCALTKVNTGGCDSGASCGIEWNASASRYQVVATNWGDCDDGQQVECVAVCLE